MLTSKQRAYLRKLAQSENAIFQVGKLGINENLIEQLKDALEKNDQILDDMETEILKFYDEVIDKYDELLEKAKKISMDSLIILILGPTAKILAYDLHNLGYRVLDLGHIAKDYDLVMKNAQRTAASLINFFQD